MSAGFSVEKYSLSFNAQQNTLKWEEGFQPPLNIRQMRPVIALDLNEPFLTEAQLEKIKELLQQELGIRKEAFERIGSYLQGELLGGNARAVLTGWASGALQVERIGSSKNGEPKFYFRQTEPKGAGGVHRFYWGFSRKGTPRAINVHKTGRGMLPAAVLHASQDPHLRGVICRIHQSEWGIFVAELGGVDLKKLNVAMLPVEERLRLHGQLLRFVQSLHQAGWVHGDLKLENVVVDETSVKGIDLELIARVGRMTLQRTGTPVYWAPNQMALHDAKQWPVLMRHDAWAMMIMMCEMEEKVQGDALISPAMLEQFDALGKARSAAWQAHRNYPGLMKAMHAYFSVRQNAFDPAVPDPTYPLDEVVFALGVCDGSPTPDVSTLSILAPEELEEAAAIRELHAVNWE